MVESKRGALFVGGVGTALLAVTAVVNFKFGHSLASGGDAVVQALLGLGIDVLGAVLATVTVALWRGHQRVYAGLVGFVLVGCVAYSMLSVVGFGAQGRVAKSQLAEQQYAAQAEAVKRANDLTAERQSKVMDWLQKTYTHADRGEKKVLADKVSEMAANRVDVQTAKVGEVADAQAFVFAEFLGVTVTSAQTMMLMALAVLSKAGEVVCFAVASSLWPRKIQVDSNGHPLYKNVQGRFEENQHLDRSDYTKMDSGLYKNVQGRQVSTAVLEEQFSLGLRYTEEAAKRYYNSLPVKLRVDLSSAHLASAWKVHRHTAAKWRKGWDAEHALASHNHDGALRVVEGGRT